MHLTFEKGKPLEYAGELYSEEHGRKFTTEKTRFQVVKEPTDRTELVLAIDRKPIAEWFKEQFEEVRQNIYRSLQPQHKGIKLQLPYYIEVQKKYRSYKACEWYFLYLCRDKKIRLIHVKNRL